jgi:DNA-binding SARP family transcriptional activator
MTEYKLQFLGDLKVMCGDEELGLPPSKKTRALLAYLAMNPRKFRREQLCELLWEIPDDPRGSLRWSLSKIRRLVDDDSNQRIIADRSHVMLDTEKLRIDCNELQELVKHKLDSSTTPDLINAARAFTGQFLAGLELASFHEFSSWCSAEREQQNRAQILLLKNLVSRLQEQPEDCLEFSRQLVSLSPYDKLNRVTLIQLMSACGREKEAKQQLEQGARLLKEVGEDAAELHQALHGKKNRTKPQDSQDVSLPSLEPAPPQDMDICLKKLVGRDAELVAMQKSFSEVVSLNQARCLLFMGEPGMGKSSLLQCADELARKENASLLQAGAFESEIVRPFALWNDALRESPHSGAVALLSGSERIDRNKLFNSLSELIAELANKAAVVILFDDIQWSDESSISALHYLLRTNAQLPIWVVLGARDAELESNMAVLSTLRGLRHDKILQQELLQPLDEDSVLKLISDQVPVVDSQVISQKSQGNPLVALELARAVADGDVLGTLNELVGERIARMREESVSMLQWATVLAPHISIGALLRYTGLDDQALDDALEDSEKNGILFATESGFQFSHGLVARSIYRGMSSARRKSMHRRVAENLENDAALDLKLAANLARHASKSGDALLAARSLVLASKLCLRFYANDDAFKQAEKGLSFVQELSGADHISLMLELKEVQLMAAPVQNWEAASSDFISLAERALDHGDLESARTGYQMASHIRWTHGQWSDAKKSIMQAERVTRGGSEEIHIIGMAEAARCLLMLEKDLPEADAMLMEASARAERKHVDSDALPSAKGMMCYYQNNLEAAAELFDEARTRSKALGDRMNEFQANEYLAMIEIEQDNFSAALPYCKNLLAIGEKLRRGSEEPLARFMQALCDYALGNNTLENNASDQEEITIDESLQALRSTDAKQRLTYALNRAALLDLKFKNWDSAISRATEALENAEIMERASELLTSRVVLTEAFKAKADEKLFKFYLKAVLATPETVGAQWARERAIKLKENYKGQANA